MAVKTLRCGLGKDGCGNIKSMADVRAVQVSTATCRDGMSNVEDEGLMFCDCKSFEDRPGT